MPILLQVAKGENREPAGTGLTRVYPIDRYEIPPAILERASKYHLLRVPVLGQHNAHDRGGDWCGRTSSSMVWCYRRLATGQVNAKSDYITHWDNRDGKGMELRMPDPSQIACNNYDLGSTLKMVDVTIPEDSRHRIFPLDGARGARVRRAAQIAASEDEVEKRLDPILSNLRNNNPMVFYSGFSTGRKFKSHIIVISGFCYLIEDGQPHLWLQITDPAPPKVGTIFSPPRDKDRTIEALRAQRDLDYLRYLKARDDIIRFHNGDWSCAEGFVYLMRARKLFEQNSVFPQDNVLWMDYMYYNGAKSGGLFSVCSEESPYDEIVVKSNCYNNLCFPLQDNADKLDSPLAWYERCEMPAELGSPPAPAAPSTTPSSSQARRVRPPRTHDGWGGYYPLGTNSTVHGGVHLLSQKNAPVRCMAPGYIVAARLRKEPQTGGRDFEKRFLNAFSGFVLVRHDLIVPTGGRPQEFPFYSLYMHLSPTTWPDSKDEYASVEWLKRFYLARRNAAINLDPTQGPVGERHWLVAPPATSGAEADRVKLVNEADMFGAPISRWVRDRQDNRYLSYLKEPPANLKAAYDALKRGDVVTFSKPLLQVSPGDILGWCKPVAQATDARTALLSGYLHWEVFAPATPSPSAFEKIKELLAASTRGIVIHPLVDPVADNFWTQGELRQQLDPLLPPADRQELAKIVEVAIPDNKTEPPAPELAETIRDFFSGRATFFDEPAGTQRPPDQLPPCNYDLTLRFDNAKFPLPAPPSGDYAYVVTYYGESSEKLGTQRFTVGNRRNANPIEDTLTVPPGTLRIGIDTYGFFLDPGEPVVRDELYGLAKKSIPHRWRNALLRHVTEWSKASIDGLLTKLKGVGLLPQSENKEPYLGCAWYGVDPAGETQLGEHAVVSPDGSKSSLFGNQTGQLPGDGRVDNLNPVTLLWALKLLQSESLANPRVCSLKSGWELLRSQQPAEPEFFGWFDDGSRPLRVGHPLWAVAIRSGYDETPVSLKAKRVSPGGAAQNAAPAEVELGSGHYTEGVFALRVGTPLWGKWDLKVIEYPNASSPGQQMDPPGPVDIEAPEISPAFHMDKDAKSGWYKLSLQFTKNCPDALYGFVAFEYLLADVDPRFAEASRWILDRATGQFIVGLTDGTDKNVTASYTLQAYFEKYQTTTAAASSGSPDVPADEVPARPRVAMKACKAVQLIFKAYADAHSHKLPSLQVTSVATDGLKVTLHLENAAEGDGVAAAVDSFANADAAPLSAQAAFDKDTGELTVSVQISEGWKRWDKCVPVLGESAAANERIVRDEKGLITGPRAGFGDDVRVSANFTLYDYMQAYDRGDQRPVTGFRVSPNLVAAVQKLRDRFGPKQWINLQPHSIECDAAGVWSIEVGSARIAQSDLLAAANRLKAATPSLFEEAVAAGRSGVVLRVRHDPAIVTAGQLEVEFDPAEAFGGLLHDVEFDDTKVLQVRAEFITRNASPPPAFPEALNAPLMDLQPGGPLKDIRDRLDAFAGKELDVQAGDWLQSRSVDIFKRLARPAFDGIEFSMNKHTLVVKVMLKGAAKDWTNANPAIYAILPDNSERLLARNLVTHTANQATLVGDLSLIRPDGNQWVADGAIVGKDIAFVARLRNADAVFDMERLQVQERRYPARNIKPRMASFEVNPGRNSLAFTARLENFPTHFAIRLRCVDGVTGKDVKLAVQYAIPSRTKEGVLNGGLCNADGVFSASVAKSQLPPGHDVTFTAQPVSSAVLGVARDDIAPPALNRTFTRGSANASTPQPRQGTAP